MDDPADPRFAKLHVLASLLDIPVDSFFAGHEAGERFIAMSECLRLWEKIKTTDGRRRALEFLREIADEAAT